VKRSSKKYRNSTLRRVFNIIVYLPILFFLKMCTKSFVFKINGVLNNHIVMMVGIRWSPARIIYILFLYFASSLKSKVVVNYHPIILSHGVGELSLTRPKGDPKQSSKKNRPWAIFLQEIHKGALRMQK
jgi:hypothetical protein